MGSVAENVIFIGQKPFLNYVTGVVMQFTTKNVDEVSIKARGKFIWRAVDVAEVTRKRRGKMFTFDSALALLHTDVVKTVP